MTKSFQTAVTDTDRNELAKWQDQRIKGQIAQQSQRAKSEAPNPQYLNPEKDPNAPHAHSTRSHSRAATESPKKGKTPEMTPNLGFQLVQVLKRQRRNSPRQAPKPS